MYHHPRWRNKQETPRRVRGSSDGRNEHRQVLRLLPHEKVFGSPAEDELLHHGRDERTSQGQPADKNPVEKEVRQNPGEHQPLVPTAPEQAQHQEVPLRDDEEQHGRSSDMEHLTIRNSTK